MVLEVVVINYGMDREFRFDLGASIESLFCSCEE